MINECFFFCRPLPLFAAQAQGKLGEAEPLYREALDGYRRTLGDSHPTTRDTIARLVHLRKFLRAARDAPCAT